MDIKEKHIIACLVGLDVYCPVGNGLSKRATVLSYHFTKAEYAMIGVLIYTGELRTFNVNECKIIDEHIGKFKKRALASTPNKKTPENVSREELLDFDK